MAQASPENDLSLDNRPRNIRDHMSKMSSPDLLEAMVESLDYLLLCMALITLGGWALISCLEMLWDRCIDLLGEPDPRPQPKAMAKAKAKAKVLPWPAPEVTGNEIEIF